MDVSVHQWRRFKEEITPTLSAGIKLKHHERKYHESKHERNSSET